LMMRRLPFTPKDLMPFVELVLEDSRDTEKLARLSYAILASGSARKSDWARFYRPGASEAVHLGVGVPKKLTTRPLSA
jgi:hypothetical protein